MKRTFVMALETGFVMETTPAWNAEREQNASAETFEPLRFPIRFIDPDLREFVLRRHRAAEKLLFYVFDGK